MTDFIQNKLNSEVEKLYAKLPPKIDIGALKEFEKAYLEYASGRSKMRDKLTWYPMVRWYIINGEVELHVYTPCYIHFRTFPKFKMTGSIVDDKLVYTVTYRNKVLPYNTSKCIVNTHCIIYFELFCRAMHYIKSKKLQLPPNTVLFQFLMSTFPYFADLDKRFPVYIADKPHNTDFILLPDFGFLNMKLAGKYETLEKPVGFELTQQNVYKTCKKCTKQNFLSKIPVVYFKGVDSTYRKCNTRAFFRDMSTDWLRVKLDSNTEYEPAHTLCRYKYLLNLPGWAPWSIRLKFLLLMCSLVIDVSVTTVSLDHHYEDEEYMTMINYLIKPGVDYIRLPMKFYRTSVISNDVSLIEEAKQKTLNEQIRVYEQIKEIHEDAEKNPDKYLPMIHHGYNIVSNLRIEHMYEYMYKCIVENSKVIRVTDNYKITIIK